MRREKVVTNFNITTKIGDMHTSDLIIIDRTSLVRNILSTLSFV